ncbi:MAG: hypothetical protein LAN71_14915 [Acidobacteriia bacterium]|nr:hypothetical protein [Terriglobia bacterium]
MLKRGASGGRLQLLFTRIIDSQPRVMDREQESALTALSRLVLGQMEFGRNLILLKQALNDRSKLEHEREREIRKLQETLLRTVGLRP